MKNILRAALISALWIPASCFASDWQWTTESNDGTYYMDFDSVAPVGNYRKAWIKALFSVDKETDGYPKKQYRSAKMLYYFDCTAKTLALTHDVNYKDADTSGEVVYSVSQKFQPKFLSDVVPDTIGAKLLSVACASPSVREKLKATNKAVVDALTKMLNETKNQGHASEAAARRANND